MSCHKMQCRRTPLVPRIFPIIGMPKVYLYSTDKELRIPDCKIHRNQPNMIVRGVYCSAGTMFMNTSLCNMQRKYPAKALRIEAKCKIKTTQRFCRYFSQFEWCLE